MEERLIVRVRLMRREGKEIPRWQHGMGHGQRGFLTIKEEHIEELNRHARVARLEAASAPDETPRPLLPLVDAQLLNMTPYSFVLTGMERISDGLTTTAYFQSWWVFPDAVILPAEAPTAAPPKPG